VLINQLNKIPIAVKMLLLTMFISIALWLVLDKYQLQDLRQAFLTETKHDLTKEAIEDRIHFDRGVRSINIAAKLISIQKPFLDYLAKQSDIPASSDSNPRFYHIDTPPQWLPKKSILRTFFNARYAIIIDAEGSVKEIYHNQPPHEAAESLPEELLNTSLLLRKLSHNQSYMTILGESPYIISAEVIKNSTFAATLLLASPIDNNFLSLISEMQPHNTITTLISHETGKVVASSKPTDIPSGAHVKDLQVAYLQTGKSFFDYGASDLELEFASFYPTDDAERLSNLILDINSHQRSILVVTLLLAFLLMSIWWSRRISQLARLTENFSKTKLGVSLNQHSSGDEIINLERNFKKLISEIEHSHHLLQQEIKLKATLADQLRHHGEELEKNNEQLQKEIDQRLQSEQELRTARESAEEANKAKSKFLSRMSHELRTPLNAILGFGYLLRTNTDQPLSDSQSDNVQEMLIAGEHLLDLVNEILDLSRIESGRLELKLECIAITPIIEKCLAQINPLATSNNITCKFDSGFTGLVEADQKRLKQVLINLLSNAIKYNKNNGTINIYCTKETQQIRVSIQDTGRGITDDAKQYLFKPFERIDSAYDGIEGTGIGLAMVKQLVEGMHGKVGVDSTIGVGSTFWFELPICTSTPTECVDTIIKDTKPANISNNNYKILYIEDNLSNQKLINRFLSSRNDIELFVAVTAEAGLDIIMNQQLDLILLDITLPGMDGFEVLKKLQSNPVTESIPVIAVTANATPADINQGMGAGFNEYLTKPININRLNDTLDRFLMKKTCNKD